MEHISTPTHSLHEFRAPMFLYITGAVHIDCIFLINNLLPQGFIMLPKSVKPPRQKAFIQNTNIKNAQIFIILRDVYSCPFFLMILLLLNYAMPQESNPDSIYFCNQPVWQPIE